MKHREIIPECQGSHCRRHRRHRHRCDAMMTMTMRTMPTCTVEIRVYVVLLVSIIKARGKTTQKPERRCDMIFPQNDPNFFNSVREFIKSLTSSRGVRNFTLERYRDRISRAPQTPMRGVEKKLHYGWRPCPERPERRQRARDAAITCNIDTKTPVCGCFIVGTRSRGVINTCGYDALTLIHICSCHTVGNWIHIRSMLRIRGNDITMDCSSATA